MSDFDDIMYLLGPSVSPFEPSSREVSRPAPPTVRDTTSEANVWLPTSVAAHYKEYDRSGPAVDELEALIARDGLLTPIRISTDGREAVVHEGNHRLQVAERLGIPEVPAIVTFDSPVFSNGGRVTPLEPVLGSWVEQNRGRLRSFWGRRTAASAGKLYRGVRIDLGVDLSLAQPGTSIETVGQELQLGPQVLDALSRQGGLGTHWSTRPEIAERFALESSGNGGGTPVLITVDWNGSGEDLERTDTGGTWTDEAEVTLLPGTPITVTSIILGSSFSDGIEILHSDRYLGYASDFAAAGLPVPQGGPQQRTAEWQPWQGDDSPESDPLPAGTTIYRGMKVDFSDSDFDQIWRWQQPPLVEDERGQHFKIGPFILDRLEPLGIHWTTKKRIAEIGASQGGYGGAGVIIEAEYTGTGQDLKGTAYHNDGWSVEEEITMLPGAQVRITGVFLTGIEKNKNLLRGPELRSATVQAGDLWRSENSVNEFDYRENRIAGDYFMNHRPAGPSNGSPMHDVSYHFPDIETLPRNVYDDMQPGGQDSIQQIIDAQGNPNKPVTIYRGVPKGVDPVIRNGDWVTISREYAVEHGYYFDESDVLSATVQAKDLWTSGDSVNEFGYWGSDVRTARIASSDIIARGFKFDEVGFELAQKYMNGTMTGRDILQEIETKWGSVGIWWGSIGSSGDDFYGSADQARDYAGWAGDGSIEHRWEDMLRLTGGQVDSSEWMDAEIRVVLVAKKPVRDYGIWNPTIENGEGSMWESTSFFAEGEKLELTEVHYAADRSGNDWKVERVPGLTVTAASSSGTLYRGLAVPFSEAQIEDVMEAYGKDSFVGRVLGYLSRGFFTPNREWGIGKHWTTNVNVAKSFSQNGFGTPVVLVAEWDGRGEDPYNAPGNNFGGEDEVTLLPETELRLVDVLWGPTFESIGGSGRTITAGGSLPPGLRLENPKPNQVVAYDDDNPDSWLSRFGVAVLSWDDDGIISWVAIQDDSYKRRGIATAMLEYARTIRPDIRHSDELSESGAGWAQAVGSRTAGTRTDPGGVYRGINVQVLSHDEQEEVAAWANGNSFSMYDYQLAEPNYELVYRILDRLDSGGLGRHWSKDYDVSADFARDQGDGIELILIGHWEGEGFDTREFHRGWDGVQRPSNLPHEEEVTLYPGTPVTLVGMDIVTETGFTYNIPVPNIQVTAGRDMKHLANRTAANDLRVHLYDSEGREMWLEPDFDGNPWTYHRKVMDAVRFLADVAQSSGVYWHMDHNEFIPSTITDFKVFDGPNDVTHEIKEFPQLRGHYASRTAAEPGGVLPWNPSHRGYTWITKTDGTLEAVTNDGVNRMFLHEYPYGWEWEVFDSLGFVEGGTFGMALKGGDALRDRANDLMAEFDTRAERRTRGPSWGYQDDYTQAPNTLWSKREALHHEEGNSSGVAIVLTIPMEYRESLAMPEGTPAEELHITLGYFGQRDELAFDLEGILAEACQWTASYLDPFIVSLGGLIRFSGEDQDAFVLNADAPEIDSVRSVLLGWLDATDSRPDDTHGFTPHMTLGYLDHDESLPFDRWEPVEVPVTAIELWWGDDEPWVFPLGITPVPALEARRTTSQRYAERLRREGRR